MDNLEAFLSSLGIISPSSGVNTWESSSPSAASQPASPSPQPPESSSQPSVPSSPSVQSVVVPQQPEESPLSTNDFNNILQEIGYTEPAEEEYDEDYIEEDKSKRRHR
jgi:hypothetical protein